MYPKLYINSTNLLTQKQQQEIAELTTFCRHHDGIDLSYPSEEEDLPDAPRPPAYCLHWRFP